MTTEPTNTEEPPYSIVDHDVQLRDAIADLSEGIPAAIPEGAMVRAYSVCAVWQKPDGQLGTISAWGGDGLLISAGITELERLYREHLDG